MRRVSSFQYLGNTHVKSLCALALSTRHTTRTSYSLVLLRIIVDISIRHSIGKVFDTEELLEIGKIAEEFDLIILADEVVCSRSRCVARSYEVTDGVFFTTQYDALVFDKEHVRIATLGNLWERTITICSAVRVPSPTFSNEFTYLFLI